MGGQLSVLCSEKRALLSAIADAWPDIFNVRRVFNALFEKIGPGPGDLHCRRSMDPLTVGCEGTATGILIFAWLYPESQTDCCRK